MFQPTEDFELAVQRGLKALEPYAADLCRKLGLSVSGEALCRKVKESRCKEYRNAPWRARAFMQKPRDAQQESLMEALTEAGRSVCDMPHEAARKRIASLRRRWAASKREQALHILQRVKHELPSEGRFALAVSLSRKTPEAMGIDWYSKGIGPYREAIERVFRAEYGDEALVRFLQYIPIWREMEGGDELE
jgi:hypothetical protein